MSPETLQKLWFSSVLLPRTTSVFINFNEMNMRTSVIVNIINVCGF